jgi:alpha-mannosidase
MVASVIFCAVAVMRNFKSLRLAVSAGSALVTVMSAQTMKAPDITKDPTLYVVPYAHLDTQWRWEFPQSINEYLLKTMR